MAEKPTLAIFEAVAYNNNSGQSAKVNIGNAVGVALHVYCDGDAVDVTPVIFPLSGGSEDPTDDDAVTCQANGGTIIQSDNMNKPFSEIRFDWASTGSGTLTAYLVLVPGK